MKLLKCSIIFFKGDGENFEKIFAKLRKFQNNIVEILNQIFKICIHMKGNLMTNKKTLLYFFATRRIFPSI